MHKQSGTIVTLIIIGFVLLGIGEYYLYRNQIKLNNMMSEGLMQIKEELKIKAR